MPIALLALGAGAGLFAGFVAGNGVSGVGNTVKYAVIGAAAFVIAKQAGVFK